MTTSDHEWLRVTSQVRLRLFVYIGICNCWNFYLVKFIFRVLFFIYLTFVYIFTRVYLDTIVGFYRLQQPAWKKIHTPKTFFSALNKWDMGFKAQISSYKNLLFSAVFYD